MADGFHDFGNNCFPKKNTYKLFSCVHFLSFCLLVLLITGQIRLYCCQGKVSNEIGVKRSKFF